MDLIAHLCGRWQLTRALDDRRNAQTAQLLGEAQFTPSPEGLTYHETGRWAAEAPWGALSASREDQWRITEGAITVFFADGRPFHQLGPITAPDASCDVRHECSPDLYLGRYEFALPDRWSLTWTVRGPAKEYVMHSTYLRAPDALPR